MMIILISWDSFEAYYVIIYVKLLSRIWGIINKDRNKVADLSTITVRKFVLKFELFWVTL